MNPHRFRATLILFVVSLACLCASGRASAQEAKAKPKSKPGVSAVRTVTVANLTFDEANQKVRDMRVADRQKDKFYVKSIDVAVTPMGVRYKVTFQTYLPRTRHAFAASRAALDEAYKAAREHGGILFTDLKAYKYNGRVLFAYVSRVVAQRDSRLNFRVLPDLPESVYQETINVQRKFNRRIIQSSKYTDRNDETRHAVLFVSRAIEVNRPNFQFRQGK